MSFSFSVPFPASIQISFFYTYINKLGYKLFPAPFIRQTEYWSLRNFCKAGKRHSILENRKPNFRHHCSM